MRAADRPTGLSLSARDSASRSALRQEQSRYSASAETAVALHGASRLASSTSRNGRGEGVCLLVGASATVTTTKQSPPTAASSCIWIGRLQAGPEQNPTSCGQRQSRCAPVPPSPRLRGLDEHDAFGCLRRGRCSHGLCGQGALCALTFELSGRQRQDARPGLAKMYCVPPDRAWWPAVGAPLERGVRFHCCRGER